MTRLTLPPTGWKIWIPASLFLDPDLSPAVRDTYGQLRCLALGKDATPAFDPEQFEALFGKSRSTLLGHLKSLRDRSTLRWSTLTDKTMVVTFLCADAESPDLPIAEAPPKDAQSENLDQSRNLDQPILKAKELDHQAKKMRSRNLDQSKKLDRDPLFEAVARVTKRTPPNDDWTKLPDVTRGILNKVTGQLRRVHATEEQIGGFPAWFEKKKQDDYRLRRPLEPWDLPKLWPEYLRSLDAGLRQQHSQTNNDAATGEGTGGVAARIAAIQRAAAQRASPDVPPLREES